MNAVTALAIEFGLRFCAVLGRLRKRAAIGIGYVFFHCGQRTYSQYMKERAGVRGKEAREKEEKRV